MYNGLFKGLLNVVIILVIAAMLFAVGFVYKIFANFMPSKSIFFWIILIIFFILLLAPFVNRKFIKELRSQHNSIIETNLKLRTLNICLLFITIPMTTLISFAPIASCVRGPLAALNNLAYYSLILFFIYTVVVLFLAHSFEKEKAYEDANKLLLSSTLTFLIPLGLIYASWC